jgi:hypothetical protein
MTRENSKLPADLSSEPDEEEKEDAAAAIFVTVGGRKTGLLAGRPRLRPPSLSLDGERGVL